MRKGYGIEGGIPVVFSLEKPKAKLLPFQGPSGEAENPSDYQVRNLPVIWSDHLYIFRARPKCIGIFYILASEVYISWLYNEGIFLYENVTVNKHILKFHPDIR